MQTSETRKGRYGFWISVVGIGALALLQIGIIVDSAMTGHKPAPPKSSLQQNAAPSDKG